MQELVSDEASSDKIRKSLNKTIKKVSEDYENLKANTAIAAMMAFLNEVYDEKKISKQDYLTLLILANPVAPHVTEEAWQIVNADGSMLHNAKWPVYDEKMLLDDEIEIPVQINGKVKVSINVGAEENQQSVLAKAKENEIIKPLLDAKTVVKEIYVPKKIINIVALK